MSLSKVLESRFRGDVRFRGAAYVTDERVEITHVTAERVYGVVHDAEEFQTQLSRSEGQVALFCTCARPGQTEIACKHVWATVLMAEADGYVNGGCRPGYFPPFSAMEDPTALNFDDDLDDFPTPDVFVSAASSRAPRQVKAPEEQLPDWELRLKEIADGLIGDDMAAATSVEREILYQLDVAASAEHGQLVIDVGQRQRRSSGQWGKLKPLKLKPGKFDEVEREEDRGILMLMGGGVIDRSTWFGQQSDFQTAVYRYRLPAELASQLLPALCETGRFTTLEEKDEARKPLKWDDGPAWQLAMSVELDEDHENWTVNGRLTREIEHQQPVDVRDVTLIVPGGFVLRGTKLAALEDFGAYEWIQLVRSTDPISVPNGEEAAFVDRLLDMPAMPRLELPARLRLTELTPAPSPQLVVTAPRGNWKHEKLRAEINFDYDGVLVRGSSQRNAVVQRDKGCVLLRDRHAERDHYRALEQNGFRRLLDRRRGIHDVEISIRDLGNAVRSLIELGWQVQADGQGVRQAGQIRFRVNTSIDWFDLQATVDFDGQTLALPELLAALSRGETTVRLDDGSLGILPEEWLEKYGLLAGLGTPDGENLRFANTQAGLLDAMLAAQDNVDYDEKFQELRERMRSFSGVHEEVEPEGFHGKLRVYQRQGLGWLRFLQDFNFGGCLADDMGLGKTIQVLALLLDRKHQPDREARPTMIVVPKSLLFNWAEEAERFAPELKLLEYSGIDRARLRDEFHGVDVILTTYGTLRRDIYQLKDIPFDYIVLDEAQTIKNSASQVARATRLLQARYRVALSGTPIENHLGDLWSIFEFLNPGMLGRSSLFRIYAADAQDQASREMLSKGLRPFILRRTKQQVANDLPDKIEQTIHCRMGAEQQKLYDEMKQHYRDSLLGMVRDQGLAKSQMHVLEALLRLRQAACHPGLLDPERSSMSSAKLDVLCSQLEELIEEGHKALVFSQFTSLLAIVKQHLDERGIVYEYLDGQTRSRKQHVDRFQNDAECQVFLISLKAGGLGLNLTAAEYVFLLDPWWNPAVEAQAIDRAHRVGQTRRVFAYRLICVGTVEEKIAELQKQKRDLADAILQENNSMLSNMSIDELDMLLS